MLRTYTGVRVRVTMQAGGHEEEHNATIHGQKRLQAGSGHGKAPNFGWRRRGRIPEESQEASGMALNYGIEPAWFRFGLVPQAPFGGAGCGAGCYGDVPHAGDYYSNFPRRRLLQQLPGGAGRGRPAGRTGDPGVAGQGGSAGADPHPESVRHHPRLDLLAPWHGHVRQRDPYVCPGQSRNGLLGACNLAGVGSRAIGVNPMGFAQGGQESWSAPSHFEIVLPGAGGWPAAGGDNAAPGDYLFRDHASFGR